MFIEGDPNQKFIEENVTEDEPSEISKERWELENDVHESPNWDEDPEKAYGDIVEKKNK